MGSLQRIILEPQHTQDEYCKQKSPSAYLITRPRIIVKTKERIARKNSQYRQNKKSKLFSLSTQVFSALLFSLYFFVFLASRSVSQGHGYGHRQLGSWSASVLGSQWQIPHLTPESTSFIKPKEEKIIRRGTFFTSVINFPALAHKSIFCILFVYLKILVHTEKNRKTRAIICSLIDVTIP